MAVPTPPGPCYGAPTCSPVAPQLWTREGARGWSRGGGSGGGARLQAAGGAAPLFLGLHGEGRHKRLHDFDDHLNDLSKRAPAQPRNATLKHDALLRLCGWGVAGSRSAMQHAMLQLTPAGPRFLLHVPRLATINGASS